jgi:hypothetical protein
VEDPVAVVAQAIQQPGGLAFASGATPPGAGLGGRAKAQPPADQRGGGQPGDRGQGPGQAGLGSERRSGETGGGAATGRTAPIEAAYREVLAMLRCLDEQVASLEQQLGSSSSPPGSPPTRTR